MNAEHPAESPDDGTTQTESPSQSFSHPPRPRLPIRTYHCRFCSHLLVATTREIEQLPRRREPAQDRALILPLPPRLGHGHGHGQPSPSGQPSLEGEGESSESGEDELIKPEALVEDQKPKPRRQQQQSEERARSENNNSAKTARDIPKSKSKKEKGRPNDHYTILLSTTLPDRKPVIIRRHDGFEKRLLLRCGRCRVVMGYLLDEAHFPTRTACGSGDNSNAEMKAEPIVSIGKDRSNTNDGGGDREGPSVVYVLPQSLVRTEKMGDGGGDMPVDDSEWKAWMQS